MNGSYLLDSNIIIDLFANDTLIVNELQKLEKVLIPAIVLGELYYGVYNSGNIEKNSKEIERLYGNVEILNVDAITAQFYGKVKLELKKKGKPILENDIWIAALAIQYNVALVSRDKHFENIDNLKLIKW